MAGGEIGGERGRVRVALRRIGGEAAFDDALQPLRHRDSSVLETTRPPGGARREDLPGGFAAKGALARQHLEHHQAECIDIRARVDFAAARLFRREVVERADDVARLRQARPVHRARDSEVRDVGAALVVDQHVGGLQVAMDHGLRVRGAERLGEVVRDLAMTSSTGSRAALVEDLPQRAAVDMVHRQEVQVAVLADVVDAHDVLVRDLAREHQFLLEALEHARIRLVGAQRLQGDVDVQPLVVHAIDHAHRADAGETDHAIAAGDQRADGEHPLSAERGFRRVRIGSGLRIGHGGLPLAGKRARRGSAARSSRTVAIPMTSAACAAKASRISTSSRVKTLPGDLLSR